MRHKWLIILAAIFGGLLLIPVGLYVSQLHQRKQNTCDFLQAVQEADSAKIHIHVRRESVILPVPPEQFARIKETLLRVRSVRPAMGGRKRIIKDSSGRIYVSFYDAEGKEQSRDWHLCAFPDLMPESHAKELSILREYDVYEPDWHLPDAELEDLMSLPIVKEAYQRMKTKKYPCLPENSCDSH